MIHCDVLVIDDDMDDIEFLTTSLTECGVYKVHFVHSSEEAFQYLGKVFPDCIPQLIVCNFFLVTGNAIGFATTLREMLTHKHIIVMVWSSSLSDIQKENLRKLEIFDYHSKPISLDGFKVFAELVKSKLGHSSTAA